LEKRIPEGAEKINENFEKLKLDMNALHNGMKNAAAGLEGQLLVASHPVYQYLEKAYGLKIESVHFEPDEMPSDQQWHDLEHLFHQQKNKIMLWEDAPNDEIQAELDKRGIQAVVFNPCGNRPSQSDFLTTMQDNLKNVKGISLNE
jgi:zinc transport system substrate-binding protein